VAAISRTGRPARRTSVSKPPFQRFLDAHRDHVWRFLVAAVGRDAADDCFQETFMAAMRAYPTTRIENPRAWVLTIAHRKALDHHRARARRPLPVGAVPDAPAPAEAAGPGPADGVWARVAELPPKQRAALLLRFAGDLSHREVARALGCSEEAARRSAHEGLKRLREELAA
jgi:DNA-directed RNA polymerase specialized sigma24 family protein